MIPRLTEFSYDCRFHAAQSTATLIDANLRYVCERLTRIAGNESLCRRGSYLDREEFRASGSKVVFCHDDFPRNADSIPVVWQNSILDPEMWAARGRTKEDLAEETRIKAKGFRAAAAVQVSTNAERLRLGKSFPEIAQKFVAIPFFHPNIVPIGESQFSKKIGNAEGVRCLFVGHEARRKGLERVYAAFQLLPSRLKERTHLTVVSSYADGHIAPPDLPNLQLFGRLPNEEVVRLMRDSDLFLMPSYFESFGIVYLESMAQGTIPVMPNWEVQREIADYGRAGIITSGEPSDLVGIIERAHDDLDLRRELATNALSRFQSEYAPSVVAKKYSDFFHVVVGTN